MEIVLGIFEGVAAIALASGLVWLGREAKKRLDNQKRLERQIDGMHEALLAHKSVTDSLRKMIEAGHDEMIVGLAPVQENAILVATRLDDIMRTVHLNQENAADVDSLLTREVSVLKQHVEALEKGSDQLIGMDEVLPRIEVLEDMVAQHERRTSGRPLSSGVERIQQHAALKRELGEDGSFSDAPRGR